ncbi:hypothetical protein ACP3V5_17190 [Vibrio maritimus]
MGVFFGTTHFVVFADSPSDCLVSVSNCYPSPLNPNVYEPVVGREYLSLGEVKHFDDFESAKEALRSHILSTTELDLLSNVYAQTSAKLDLERLQHERKVAIRNSRNVASDAKGYFQQEIERLDKRIECHKSSVAKFDAQVRVLRALRRRKIEVSFLPKEKVYA